MKRSKLVKVLSAALSAAVAISALPGGSVIQSYAAGDSTLLESFSAPEDNTDAKPMVRFWFPDAGAGLSSEELQELKALGQDIVITESYLEMVADQIRELYEAGFGGVEMTMLSDGTEYDNTVAQYAGWGTKSWTKVLTQALYTANSLGEGEFKVDITMTAHWPLIIDTIDPNDDEQQQQTASSKQTINEADLDDDTVMLKLPDQRHKDTYNTVQLNDSDRCASFLFTSKLVGATLAVQNEDGTLVFDSLRSIGADKAKDAEDVYEGYAAGVPGTDYIVKIDDHWSEAEDQNLVELNEAVVTEAGIALNPGDIAYESDGKYYEVEKTTYTDTFGINIEKQDAQGNSYYEDENGRRFMDDWQYLYQVNIVDIKAAMDDIGALETGQSYVLVNAYREGTGCISSGGTTSATTMNNRTYEIDYYNHNGVQEIIDYWENNMLDETVQVLDGSTTTLRDQLNQSGVSCIFEDSLELSTSSSFWSAYFIDAENAAGNNEGYEGDWERLMGYTVGAYLPILYGYQVTGDEGMAEKIKKDSDLLFDELFTEEHRKPISEWAHTIGGGYRFQCSSNLSEASNVDVIEADNGTLNGDGIRTAASTVNVRGDQYLSMEAITSTTSDPDYFQTFMELNMNFSGGINRVILHGTPFKQAVVNEMNYWPGWGFADDYWGSGYGAWNSRQPLWENVDILTDYVTRVQGLLQQGVTKIPVLFVGTADMQSLLDAGYHYNVASEDTLMMAEADADKVVDGVLMPEGLGTQVLILNGINSVNSAAFVKRLKDYADNGLKIVLYNGTEITSVNGVQATDIPDSSILAEKTDAAVQAAFTELKAHKNVISSIDSETKLLQFLNENVSSQAAYEQSGLELTQISDPVGESEYYFFWNNNSDGKVSYGNVGVGLDMSSVIGNNISTTVTLSRKNNESIYKMDAYNGEITEITNYKDNGNGTSSFQLDIEAWDTAIIVVSPETEAFEAAGAVMETAVVEGTYADLSEADWDLMIQSYAPAVKNGSPDAPFYESSILELVCGTVKLGLWKDLDLGTQELESVGITSEKYDALVDDYHNGGHLVKGNYLAGADNLQSYLSGIGYYTTEIEWDGEMEEAYFLYDHRDTSKTGDAQINMDMVTEVSVVNAEGERTTFDKISPLSNKVNLGDALSEGTNQLTIKLTTTLRNRELLEGSLVWRYDLVSQGLTSAAIQGYTVEKSDLDLAVEEANKAKEEAEKAKEEAERAAEQAAQAEAEAKAAETAAKEAEEAAKAAQKKSESEQAAAEKAKQEAQAALTAANKQAAEAKNAAQNAQEAQAKAEKAAKEAQDALQKLQSQSSNTTVTVKKAAIKKVTSSKKKQAKVVWKKITGVNGYQVQYSTSKKFKKAKTKLVSKSSAAGVTLKKLKSGKKYYIRVRAYKNVNGKKVYGKYSNVKQIKVK